MKADDEPKLDARQHDGIKVHYLVRFTCGSSGSGLSQPTKCHSSLPFGGAVQMIDIALLPMPSRTGPVSPRG